MTFSLPRLTRIRHRMFWWTEDSISCSNLSATATCEHADYASSPTRLLLMGRGEKPGGSDKHSPDIPGPPVLEDQRAGATSPMVALLKTPAPVSCTTKSRNKLPASSPSRGPAPTTSWPVVPCNVPPALGTSDTDTIIGWLGDVTGHNAD
jgi:hypothetical protein